MARAKEFLDKRDLLLDQHGVTWVELHEVLQ